MAGQVPSVISLLAAIHSLLNSSGARPGGRSKPLYSFRVAVRLEDVKAGNSIVDRGFLDFATGTRAGMLARSVSTVEPGGWVEMVSRHAMTSSGEVSVDLVGVGTVCLVCHSIAI
jgi:hypothetical protein